MVNRFLVCEPLRGWRRVSVSDRRTRVDRAACAKALVDVHSPAADKVVLFLDRLNTRSPASLDEAFAPAEAKRIADKLEIHYAPKHGSWLNVAELELRALQRRGLDRRLADRPSMEREVGAWMAEGNAAEATIDWRCTTADALLKPKRLHPTVHA